MDYVVGSVAALISGNVTPNRPKLVRRALTPTKHPPSPNVTPKSEFVDDRSIFLSPTQQKKKAVVKKSPKRIFQNPDLDGTEESEGNSSLASPKAEKVKKHLKEQLEANDMAKNKKTQPKSSSSNLDKSSNEVSPSKKSKILDENPQAGNSTPKKKKRGNSESNANKDDNIDEKNNHSDQVEAKISENNVKSPKKKRKSITVVQPSEVPQTQNIEPKASVPNTETATTQPNQEKKKNKKNKKKNKKPQAITETPFENKENATEAQNPNKKNKKRKNKAKQSKPVTEEIIPQESKEMDVDDQSESESEEVKSRNIPNPNAIIEKDSDSEHESDNEIESENEQENEKIFTSQNENEPESSEDEEEESSNKKKTESKKNEKETVVSADEIKRTLFVGNVPYNSKCKKTIKKLFSKYGKIDTVRIRTIPVKDARVTPKLAIIKNELHPERTTVNVYVKFSDPDSVRKAVAENNTVVNGNHLRVSPSEQTGAEHDPRCAVFVGNVPFGIEDDVLRSKFEKCGDITSVRLIRDKKTNAGKGFGYVNFASKDGVELALALTEEDLTIKNRIMRVKRCTQQRPEGGKPRGNRSNQQGGNRPQQGGNRPQYQGGNRPQQGRGNQGQAGKWGGHAGNRGGQGQGKWGNQGQGGRGQGGKWGNQGQVQGGKWGNQGQGQGQGGKWGNQGQVGEDGAMRRLMNKRKQQESSGDGPPNKRQKNLNQPSKEKKPRKEFVGMTADKKKKQKFDKGQKKKKALSEILMKHKKNSE